MLPFPRFQCIPPLGRVHDSLYLDMAHQTTTSFNLAKETILTTTIRDYDINDEREDVKVLA